MDLLLLLVYYCCFLFLGKFNQNLTYTAGGIGETTQRAASDSLVAYCVSLDLDQMLAFGNALATFVEKNKSNDRYSECLDVMYVNKNLILLIGNFSEYGCRYYMRSIRYYHPVLSRL